MWYKVRIFSSERELVRDVTPPPLNADGFHVGAVTNGSLGVLDLSLVANGAYDLELTVRAGYRQSSTNVRFALESDLKIGHFSFSEQDLVLPVNGFPLTITRTYNSLNLKAGDFGRSWTFSFSDLQLELPWLACSGQRMQHYASRLFDIDSRQFALFAAFEMAERSMFNVEDPAAEAAGTSEELRGPTRSYEHLEKCETNLDHKCETRFRPLSRMTNYE